ncbi:hypothetical protein Ddc_16334 [Ditylenchus destructor]|nr:hypothetical protein Ddc_16334 [Ditylenchus destructor]
MDSDTRINCLKFLDRNSLDSTQLSSRLLHSEISKNRNNGQLPQKYYFKALYVAEETDLQKLDVDKTHRDMKYFVEDEQLQIQPPIEEELTTPTFLNNQQNLNCCGDFTAISNDLCGKCIMVEKQLAWLGLPLKPLGPKRLVIWLERFENVDNSSKLGIFINNKLTSESAARLVHLFSHFNGVYFDKICFDLALNHELIIPLSKKIRSIHADGRYELQCNSFHPHIKTQFEQLKLLQQGHHLVTKVFGKCRFNISVQVFKYDTSEWLNDVMNNAIVTLALKGRHCFSSPISFHFINNLVNPQQFVDKILTPLIEHHAVESEETMAEVQIVDESCWYPYLPESFEEEEAITITENAHGEKDYYFERINKPTGKKFKVVFTFHKDKYHKDSLYALKILLPH